MNITVTHHELVQDLKKPGKEIIQSLTPDKADLWHMSTGLIGEDHELIDAIQNHDAPNTIEELGDSMFYLRGIAQNPIVDLDYDAYNYQPEDFSALHYYEQYREAIATLHDLIKKVTIYNKSGLEGDIRINTGRAIVKLKCLAETLGHSPEVCEDTNIKKLLTRYKGGKYSDAAAQLRADKEEGE